MKTKIILLTLLMATTLIAPVLAKGPTGKAGMSDVQLLYLFEKDDVTWEIVPDGAWGKMKYNLRSGDYVFNGHGLEAGMDYTLINFARINDAEWPATINVLSSGLANGGGNVHIAGNQLFESLAEDGTTGSLSGIKIWLVLSSDINAAVKLAGWTPGEYLFEANTIPIP